jgi:hypothetical protein
VVLGRPRATGPKTGSGAAAELLRRQVALRDDLLEETDGGRWPALKDTAVSTAMEAALWRRGGGARRLRMSWNREEGGSGWGRHVEEGKEGSGSTTRGSARPATTRPRRAVPRCAARLQNRRGRAIDGWTPTTM